MSEWRVRVTGKQRKDVDTALVIQAVIALGKQLERERREQAARDVAVEPHGESVPGVAP
jgi:hypothetical protein